MSHNMKIFIGYDSRETVAWHVLTHSIMRRASRPVEIVPLVQPALRAAGLYTRERGTLESTEFSMTRFLTPHLSGYTGCSLFMDSDMLVLCDLTRLEFSDTATVSVAQHDYTPKTATKFLGQEQTKYPRKNWSSFMLFKNSQCCALSPEYVNTAPALDLHRFKWVKSDWAIGSLPLEYNHLVGEYGPNPKAKVLHFTLGGPWFEESADCDHADLWREERDHMLGRRSSVAMTV